MNRVHGIFHPAYDYAYDRICRVCMKDFGTCTRMPRHLRYDNHTCLPTCIHEFEVLSDAERAAAHDLRVAESAQPRVAGRLPFHAE
eukprot:10092394-Karenia_brevis.AAC.1